MDAFEDLSPQDISSDLNEDHLRLIATAISKGVNSAAEIFDVDQDIRWNFACNVHRRVLKRLHDLEVMEAVPGFRLGNRTGLSPEFLLGETCVRFCSEAGMMRSVNGQRRKSHRSQQLWLLKDALPRRGLFYMPYIIDAKTFLCAEVWLELWSVDDKTEFNSWKLFDAGAQQEAVSGALPDVPVVGDKKSEAQENYAS